MRRASNDLIYDVGMNNGDDTAYYLSLGFRTVAIEANPELVRQASLRFTKELESDRLIILNVGVSDREGHLPFWICETNSRWSSFDRACASWESSTSHQITVPCTRFETVVAEYGVPYFCKIDIQGNDPLCLEGFRPHKVPRFLSIEAIDRRQLEQLICCTLLATRCSNAFVSELFCRCSSRR
jgi:FkbM family methyltransferase